MRSPTLGSRAGASSPSTSSTTTRPQRIREHVSRRHGRLDLLVNNAGAAWRARFADGGYENVRRTMAINFDAQVRLTEALLPLLRASAPSAIVNVASTAARVARAGTGAYSASKFALAGWSDSLWAEERAPGVHVGLVLPGFISTEGFPQSELTAKPWTRWIVSTPERAAEAIYEAGIGRRAERYVPRAYALVAAHANTRARARAPRPRRQRRRRHDDDHRAPTSPSGATGTPRTRRADAGRARPPADNLSTSLRARS